MVQTEKLLNVLAKTATKVLEALKDGKISIAEAVVIIVTVAGIVGPIRNFKEILAECKAIQAKEDVPKLFAIVEQNFKLPDPAMDARFKQTLAVIEGVLLEVL